MFADTGIICYARFQNDICAIIICNNLEESRTVSVPVRDVGIRDECCFSIIFKTDQSGFTGRTEKTDTVKNGVLKIKLTPQSAVIMIIQ